MNEDNLTYVLINAEGKYAKFGTQSTHVGIKTTVDWVELNQADVFTKWFLIDLRRSKKDLKGTLLRAKESRMVTLIGDNL